MAGNRPYRPRILIRTRPEIGYVNKLSTVAEFAPEGLNRSKIPVSPITRMNRACVEVIQKRRMKAVFVAGGKPIPEICLDQVS